MNCDICLETYLYITQKCVWGVKSNQFRWQIFKEYTKAALEIVPKIN